MTAQTEYGIAIDTEAFRRATIHLSAEELGRMVQRIIAAREAGLPPPDDIPADVAAAIEPIERERHG